MFHALTKKEALDILDLQIEELRRRLIKHGLGLNVNNAAKKHLLEKGYDASNGVRPMRRLLQDTIEDAIAHGILKGSYNKGDIIQVSLEKKKLQYSASSE